MTHPLSPAGHGPAHERLRHAAGPGRILAGTSLKSEHVGEILGDASHDGFFEIHAENYMGAGGPPHRWLTAVREAHPLSIHGVGMSIGGPGPLDAAHLSRFRELVARYQPMLVSEHLAWSSHGSAFYNDLLPLPYTPTTLERVCEHIDQVQNAIGRPLLLENPSTYLAFVDSTMTETEFLAAVSRRTGCGLLLDVNNVFVSSRNLGESAAAYLAAFPLDRVGQIHLAGHRAQEDDRSALLIDSHDCAVSDAVWQLYGHVIELTGPIPTLVEWDGRLPDWPTLRAQARRAHAVLAGARAVAREEASDHAY